MQYVLLIQENEQEWDNLNEAEQGEIMEGYETFSQYLTDNGHMRSGERLQPSNTATTVRVRNEQICLTDGPFSETKEQLGGFFIVEAKDLDQAARLAAMIPTAKQGAIEVRPIWEMSDG